MATPDTSPEDAELLSVPLRPLASNRNRWILGVPPVDVPHPEIDGRRLLGLRGPRHLVRRSLAPLLAFVADDRLTEAVRFRGEQLEPGTTVGEAFWPDGPPARAAELEALDDPLPEEALKRPAKADALQDKAPDDPLHAGRRPEVKGRLYAHGYSPAEIGAAIRETSAEALVVAPWTEDLLEEGEEADGVWLRLDRLAAYLNREVTKRLLDARGRTKEADPRAVDLDGLEAEEAAAVLLEASSSGHADRVLVDLWAAGLEERARLSPAQEEVWRLHRKGLTNEEIADETGRAVGTVQSHLARARKALRKALQKSM